MSQFWTPTENFGKSLANGEITEDNAAEKTEAFNKSFTETLN
jgi:arabinogalactan oligomer/maltooligosaccharide transport system substrate-binding protein